VDSAPSASTDVELVRRGFEAIARGDLDAVGELLAPEARWHAAGYDDAGCQGRAEVLDFIDRKSVV